MCLLTGFVWLAVWRAKFSYPRPNLSGEIRPKAVGFGIFGGASNFDKCRLKVAGDVISSATLENFGIKCLPNVMIAG